MAGALALAVLLAVASLHAEAVWLDVPQSGTKCVSEEIQSNVVVLTDYSIMYESHPYSHPTIAVKVSLPAILFFSRLFSAASLEPLICIPISD